jgi:hypothetical protein
MGPRHDIREGDIEAIRRRAKDEGRPIQSTTVITKEGTRVNYANDGDKVKIVGEN